MFLAYFLNASVVMNRAYFQMACVDHYRASCDVTSGLFQVPDMTWCNFTFRYPCIAREEPWRVDLNVFCTNVSLFWTAFCSFLSFQNCV